MKSKSILFFLFCTSVAFSSFNLLGRGSSISQSPGLDAPIQLQEAKASLSAAGSRKKSLRSRSRLPWADNIHAAIQPLWDLLDGSTDAGDYRATKFAFVHIFKTAGSTMRLFFDKYAQSARSKSYATVISCTGAKFSSFKNEANWERCKMREYTSRKGRHQVYRGNQLNNTFVKKQVDIMGGHFRLGLLDAIPNMPRSRYLAFFRNAASKYVSGFIYVKQQRHRLSENVIVEGLKKELNSNFKKGKHHSKYESYLLTPEQIERGKNGNRTERNQIIKENLIKYNVTIGIVEQMPQSMEIIRHIMDPYHRVPKKIFLAPLEKDLVNVSPFSTSSILKRLQNDTVAYKQLLEYVKYEQEITDFALSLHKQQYQAVKEQRKRLQKLKAK